MPKLYFPDLNPEFCYTLDAIEDMMLNDERKSAVLTEAKRDVGGDHFFCKEHGECYERIRFYCGSHCKEYAPRNGKSGICKHWGHTFSPTDKTITVKIEDL
jgi:hypothetical protein